MLGDAHRQVAAAPWPIGLHSVETSNTPKANVGAREKGILVKLFFTMLGAVYPASGFIAGSRLLNYVKPSWSISRAMTANHGEHHRAYLPKVSMIGDEQVSDQSTSTHEANDASARSLASTIPLPLLSLATTLANDGAGLTLAQALVRLGDDWAAELDNQAKPRVELQKVPGCISVVKVSVEVQDGCLSRVHGTADARVARGLLAYLARCLEGMTVETILGIDPKELCRSLGESFVSPSRANGFASMMNVIKQQVSDQAAGRKTEINDPALAESSLDKWSGKGGADEVAVLLSGGVDSSVALRLVQEAGMKPRAFYLKIWLEDELAHLNECPWEEDLKYATAVAEQAGVPLEVVSLQREYWDRVVVETVDEAREGRTPNPDILCNSRIKFGMFYDIVGKHFSKIVTGHYARTHVDDQGNVHLLCSPDSVKDQTYFLSTLSQDQLKAAIFPIGEFQKSRVRELAAEWDLPTMKRRDSQGICFLGKLKWDDFLEHYLGQTPGEVRELETRDIIGQHRGLHFHTIGQRKGVGPVLNTGHVHRGPFYVAAKDTQNNILYVTTKYEELTSPRSNLLVRQLSWTSGHPPLDLSVIGGRTRLLMKVRHGPDFVNSIVERIDGDTLHIKADRPLKSVTPGQFAAFYQEDVCLGAGTIQEDPLNNMLDYAHEDRVKQYVQT